MFVKNAFSPHSVTRLLAVVRLAFHFCRSGTHSKREDSGAPTGQNAECKQTERVRDKSDIFTLLKIESIFLGADFVCLKILGNVHGFFLMKLLLWMWNFVNFLKKRFKEVFFWSKEIKRKMTKNLPSKKVSLPFFVKISKRIIIVSIKESFFLSFFFLPLSKVNLC